MSDRISALLSKTSKDVMEVLEKQLESFQSLNEMNRRTASIELSVRGTWSQLQFSPVFPDAFYLKIPSFAGLNPNTLCLKVEWN